MRWCKIQNETDYDDNDADYEDNEDDNGDDCAGMISWSLARCPPAPPLQALREEPIVW